MDFLYCLRGGIRKFMDDWRKKLSVGVLSYKAPTTLAHTLESYNRGALTSCANEALVFFNAITAEDRDLATRCGFASRGSVRNLGIQGGMEALARSLAGPYVLMLQNDCPLVSDAVEVERYLRDSIALLDSGKADMVRCRSRTEPGQGFADAKKYAHFYGPGWGPRLLRLLRPFRARRAIGRAPYAVPDAELRHPRYIKREGDFLVVDSAVINFTDQSFVISRGLLLELFGWANEHPKRRLLNGFQVLEINLNSRWWRERHFRVAVGEGLFTHERADGGFRAKRKDVV